MGQENQKGKKMNIQALADNDSSLEIVEEKKMEFHEVETKYRVEGALVYDWKQLVSGLEEESDFIYVESDDIYYTNGDEFLRYRFSNHKKDKRAEITYKSKVGETNNVVRKEVNLRVDQNSKETVEAFTDALGYTFNFRITKIVHIYKFKEVTLPFYTVIDQDGKRDHFMEIEVDEELLHSLTEDQAWDIIRKWEEILAPVGITAQKRLRKSLFEMYRKESK